MMEEAMLQELIEEMQRRGWPAPNCMSDSQCSWARFYAAESPVLVVGSRLTACTWRGWVINKSHNFYVSISRDYNEPPEVKIENGAITAIIVNDRPNRITSGHADTFATAQEAADELEKYRAMLLPREIPLLDKPA
jgi:hypothetical protein